MSVMTDDEMLVTVLCLVGIIVLILIALVTDYPRVKLRDRYRPVDLGA